ncbi:MAG TPA: glycosyltransferase [Candidatus Sulfotelmatobacter sp.]|nr:glycosyltransferase [Candidatus Sulfotelmatobacter sp.]
MQSTGRIPTFFSALPGEAAPLKICLITCFPPSQGDLNEYGFHVASALRNEPAVDLVLLADQIAAGQELDGFKIERCWRFDSLLTPLRLLSAIRKEKPDVVWFNMGFSTFARKPAAAFLSITCPALARMLGFYTHVTLHTLFERINLKDAGVRMPGVYRLAGRLATRVLLCANDVSVLLPSFRSELLGNYRVPAERVHSRPHGTFSRPVAAPAPAKQPEERIILAFGYWGTYKRLDLVLEYLDRVVEAVPNAVLMIAGTNHPSTPGYLESLQAQYAHRRYVRFLGYVPETQLPDLFRKATVLVLPYTSAAGTSGVVHQACEYGLPAVAAAIPELTEIAEEHSVAMDFYPPGDGAVLAERLIRLLKSEELRREIAQKNLSAGNNMQISQVVGGYLNLFKSRARRSPVNGDLHKRRNGHEARLAREVGNWLLHSGIEEANGGVARYHLSDVRRNKPISTEITGYCASGLVVLNEQTGDTRYWNAALNKTEFLKNAWDPHSHAMPFEVDGEHKYSYFFDNGIIVRGFLAVWRRSGHPALLSAAVKLGESMAQHFFDGCSFSPIITLPDKIPLPYEPARWSRSPGCYQLKSAMAWRELWESTKQERFNQLYLQVLQAGLESHRSFLPVEVETSVMDRLHAYSYFLEGLLPEIKNQACREAMQLGIPLLSQFADTIAPKFLRSDVMAQLLRVRIYADCAGAVPLDREVCRREAALIREFQSSDPDPRLKGGFWFGRKDGTNILPFMNPVSTVFCYQALEMWDRYEKGERHFRWQDLI